MGIDRGTADQLGLEVNRDLVRADLGDELENTLGLGNDLGTDSVSGEEDNCGLLSSYRHDIVIVM